MPKDLGQWGFLVLVILIAAPILFWLISMFIVWVRWLVIRKDKLNSSYAIIEDFNGEVKKGHLTINYSLGVDSSIKINIVDQKFKEIDKVLNAPHNKGKHSLNYNISSLNQGAYFCQLITDNQKITKKFIVV